MKKDNLYFLSGNHAFAQGAYEAGVEIACGYPGTPSSEILEYLSRFDDVDTQWSVNEKVAYEVAIGGAIGGRRALYTSKHVGINVAADPLMSSAYTGVNAGFVVVTADDPGMHSSQNEQDNRLFARMAQLPLLEPSSPEEARKFVIKAFSISEQFDTPVIIRLTTRISHTKESLKVGKRKKVPARTFRIIPEKYVLVPRNAYRRHIILQRRLEKLKTYAEKSALNRIEWSGRKLGIVTSGVAYLYAKEMFPDASFLKLGMSFPFPDGLIKEFASRVKEVRVVEELEPFLEEHLALLGIRNLKKRDATFRVGELRPEYIPMIVSGEKKRENKTKSRRPLMCPGCPHRPVFWVLKKAKAVVTGDIGCYTLGALPPLASLHTCLCMGAGFTFAEGFRRAGVKNVVGVIGDSTFVHSGITGLVNAVYNKSKGLLIILDNSTTAMTGNQPHPATGMTIKGEPTKTLELENLCYSCGADEVKVVNPHNLKVLEQAIRGGMQEDKLVVLITRAPCRLIERTKDAPPVYLREKCLRCYKCLEIDCPALSKDDEGYIVLDKQLCVGCNLCVEVCPFSALIKSDEEKK